MPPSRALVDHIPPRFKPSEHLNFLHPHHSLSVLQNAHARRRYGTYSLCPSPQIPTDSERAQRISGVRGRERVGWLTCTGRLTAAEDGEDEGEQPVAPEEEHTSTADVDGRSRKQSCGGREGLVAMSSPVDIGARYRHLPDCAPKAIARVWGSLRVRIRAGPFWTDVEE